jgi:hypothetical protein
MEPVVITGWMRKQGRKGLIRNWKKRFFVLKAGKLTYYSDEGKGGDGENMKVGSSTILAMKVLEKLYIKIVSDFLLFVFKNICFFPCSIQNLG